MEHGAEAAQVIFGIDATWMAASLFLLTYALIMLERVNRAIIADQSTPKAMDIGLDANRGRAVARFEVDEIRPVHDARHDFANIVWLAVIDRHDTGDFVRIVERRRDIFHDPFRAPCVPGTR